MANAKTTRTVNRDNVSSDLVRSVAGDHCWSDCVFANSQAAAHVIGQVMKDDGSGGQIPITAETDTVTGILTYPVDATGAADVEGFLLDTDATVAALHVVYFSGANAAQKAAIDAKLNALGVKVRQSA